MSRLFLHENCHSAVQLKGQQERVSYESLGAQWKINDMLKAICISLMSQLKSKYERFCSVIN